MEQPWPSHRTPRLHVTIESRPCNGTGLENVRKLLSLPVQAQRGRRRALPRPPDRPIFAPDDARADAVPPFIRRARDAGRSVRAHVPIGARAGDGARGGGALLPAADASPREPGVAAARLTPSARCYLLRPLPLRLPDRGVTPGYRYRSCCHWIVRACCRGSAVPRCGVPPSARPSVFARPAARLRLSPFRYYRNASSSVAWTTAPGGYCVIPPGSTGAMCCAVDHVRAGADPR